MLALEPPVLLLDDLGGTLVKHDVREEAFDLWDEEREVADAGGLQVVVLEAAVGVGGELLGVDADLEGDGALPCEAAEEGRRGGSRERRGRMAGRVGGHPRRRCPPRRLSSCPRDSHVGRTGHEPRALTSQTTTGRRKASPAQTI